jgi:DNA replication factor GINS
MVTTIYEETFDAWRKEFRSPELQNLRPDYYKDVAAHVRRLKEAQRNLDQKSLKAGLLEDEMERLQILVNQLLGKRVEKIMQASRQGLEVSVGPSEKWVLEESTSLARHLERMREDLAQGHEPPLHPEKKKGNVLVRFVKDVPSIIGMDLKARGPFQKEDLASLPWENAESLLRQGVAVEIRTPIRENG